MGVTDGSDIGAALMTSVELMAPILDAADGIRSDLERRGWSPTAAEQIAAAWLVMVFRSNNGGPG